MKSVFATLVLVVGLLLAGQGAVAAQPVDAPTPAVGESPTLADLDPVLTNDEPASDEPRSGGDDGDDSGGGGGELVP